MWRRSFFDELRRIQEEMDTLFNQYFARDLFNDNIPKLTSRKSNNNLVKYDYREPLVDIYDNDKEVIAKIELPGIKKQDIELNIKDNGLEIKVEKKNEIRQEDKKKGRYLIERSYAGFYRYLPLPGEVDASKAEATYKDGLLEVRIPKVESKKKKSKPIRIK